jgi:hypothetical protein
LIVGAWNDMLTNARIVLLERVLGDISHDRQRSEYVCGSDYLFSVVTKEEKLELTNVQMRIRFVDGQRVSRDAVCGDVERAEVVVGDDIVFLR